MKTGRPWKRVILGTVIALAALWLTFRETDWDGLGRVVASSNLLPLILIVPLLTGSYIFRVLRWRVLLSHMETVPYRVLTPPVLVAFMMNSVFPGRLGEVARAIMLSRKTSVPFSSGFATVVVARLFDGLSLTFMTLLVMASMWESLGAHVRTGLIMAGGGYLLVLAFLAVLRAWHGRAAELLVRPMRLVGLQRPADKAERLLCSFADGLSVLRNPRDVLKTGVLSAGIWCCLTASVIPVFLSLGIRFHWNTAPLVLVLAGLGMLIPTPAGTGTVHYLIGVVFPVITGIPDTSAKALAILFHASQFLPIIIAGLVAQGNEMRRGP